MKKIQESIDKLKTSKPLILNLTNFVTMDFVANCLLAIGALPIMCVYEEELEELVIISSAIYINIGTLNNDFINLVKKAIILSSKYNKPIILDPVGCGATNIRTKTANLLANHSKIIRGNASEIMALGNDSFSTKGVDSIHKTEDATEIANIIAKNTKATIVVSGAIDYVTNAINSANINFGSPIMTNITGMGCALTAVIAAIFAVEHDPFEASISGSQYFALCGELVYLKHSKPGSFKAAFIDELYSPNFDLMRELYDQRR
jgi:hydroxyethylthiazole kinase